MGGGNGLNVEVNEHRIFLQYLKQNDKNIWIAPMLDVAEHIKDWQTNNILNK